MTLICLNLSTPTQLVQVVIMKANRRPISLFKVNSQSIFLFILYSICYIFLLSLCYFIYFPFYLFLSFLVYYHHIMFGSCFVPETVTLYVMKNLICDFSLYKFRLIFAIIMAKSSLFSALYWRVLFRSLTRQFCFSYRWFYIKIFFNCQCKCSNPI